MTKLWEAMEHRLREMWVSLRAYGLEINTTRHALYLYSW